MLLNTPRSSQRNRRAHVPALALLAVGGIAIAASVSTGCVSSGLYTQVEQERDRLMEDNAKLKSEIESAKSASEAANQEKTRLAQERAALAAEKTALEEKLVREREEEAKKLKATYDGLVKDLKKELEAGQVEVQQLRDGLRVNVAQDILFDSGSAALDKNGTQVLTKVSTQLKKSPHQILVIGHTDNKPIRPVLAKQYPSNWELGGARAASVVRLFAQNGLPSKRMRAVSVADVQPVASNKTEEGRSKNRRIEIRLRPISDES
jgi:chemotaxis protein MotB